MLLLSSLSMDIYKDGQFNIPHAIIIFEGDATKYSSLPVYSHFVVFLQCLRQFFGVLGALALHSKIIKY